MKMQVKVGGLRDMMETLERLPQNVVSKKGGPAKLALKKGAYVLRDEVKQRYKTLVNDAGNNDSTGLLEKNIIASRGKKPTNVRGERYLVRVKRKMYPKRDNRGAVSTLKSAQLFEYGSEHQNASPFIRPAFQSKAQEAIYAVRDDLLRRIEKLVKKHGLDTDPDNSLSL